MDCDCKLYGNQHGTFYRFCPDHEAKVRKAAEREGITPQQFFNDALRAYLVRGRE